MRCMRQAYVLLSSIRRVSPQRKIETAPPGNQTPRKLGAVSVSGMHFFKKRQIMLSSINKENGVKNIEYDEDWYVQYDTAPPLDQFRKEAEFAIFKPFIRSFD